MRADQDGTVVVAAEADMRIADFIVTDGEMAGTKPRTVVGPARIESNMAKHRRDDTDGGEGVDAGFVVFVVVVVNIIGIIVV